MTGVTTIGMEELEEMCKEDEGCVTNESTSRENSIPKPVAKPAAEEATEAELSFSQRHPGVGFLAVFGIFIVIGVVFNVIICRKEGVTSPWFSWEALAKKLFKKE